MSACVNVVDAAQGFLALSACSLTIHLLLTSEGFHLSLVTEQELASIFSIKNLDYAVNFYLCSH